MGTQQPNFLHHNTSEQVLAHLLPVAWQLTTGSAIDSSLQRSLKWSIRGYCQAGRCQSIGSMPPICGRQQAPDRHLTDRTNLWRIIDTAVANYRVEWQQNERTRKRRLRMSGHGATLRQVPGIDPSIDDKERVWPHGWCRCICWLILA